MSSYGEMKVVIRSKSLRHAAGYLDHIEQLLKRPYGLLLICGPTGSGKTVTLYAMLRMLNLEETKLICLEDPGRS